MTEFVLIYGAAYSAIALVPFTLYMIKGYKDEKLHCAAVCALWGLILAFLLGCEMWAGFTKRTSEDICHE